MINKDLRRLTRRELVDVIYQMKRNEEQLQERISELEKALEDKRLRLSTAGSIAEASTAISNVFGAAQSAADIYLEEISTMRKEAADECEKIINEAKQEAEKILAEAENHPTEVLNECITCEDTEDE